MLNDLHASLRRLILERGMIDARDVDIEFDPPVRQWINAVARPTLSLFLFEMEENTDLRQTQMQTSRSNGQGVHRMPPRRLDLRYMVSAITTDIADEHLLLWRALVTLMKHPTLPEELLPDGVRTLGVPITTGVSRPEDNPRTLDLWSALETHPRPALLYTVTVPVDLEIAITAPLVFTRTTRYARVAGEMRASDERTQIGGVVLDAKRQPVAGARVSIEGRAAEAIVTDAAGQFVLAELMPGDLTLRVVRGEKPPKLVKVHVPSDSYEVVVE